MRLGEIIAKVEEIYPFKIEGSIKQMWVKETTINAGREGTLSFMFSLTRVDITVVFVGDDRFIPKRFAIVTIKERKLYRWSDGFHRFTLSSDEDKQVA